jgi:hypothetical protein
MNGTGDLFAVDCWNAVCCPYLEYMSDGKICSFLSCAVSTRILSGPNGANTANRSHRLMTAEQ